MRVIAGSARRLPLKTIDGLDTRPTTDRIKETLFNILQPDIYGINFLDLFSGSGSIGIEALSRGAGKCVFVENNKKAVECIKDNLNFTKLQNGGEVLYTDALTALNRLKGNEKFDVIYMDPPYNKELEKEVLSYLTESDLLDKDTLIIIEASLDTSFDYLEDLGYKLIREKKYKTNKHVFIKRL